MIGSLFDRVDLCQRDPVEVDHLPDDMPWRRLRLEEKTVGGDTVLEREGGNLHGAVLEEQLNTVGIQRDKIDLE